MHAAVEQVIEVPQVDVLVALCAPRSADGGTAGGSAHALFCTACHLMWTGFSSASGEMLPATALRTGGAQRTDEQVVYNPGAASKK